MVREIMKDTVFPALTRQKRAACPLKTFTDFTAAEIIQHEIDHCDGIII